VQIGASDTPYRRARIAVFAPASAALSAPMICFCVTLARFLYLSFSGPDSDRAWQKIRGLRHGRQEGATWQAKSPPLSRRTKLHRSPQGIQAHVQGIVFRFDPTFRIACDRRC
jgi:hypothetical protein